MPTIVIAAGIDGTGSAKWGRTDGANSHVLRFLDDLANEAVDTKFLDGPGTSGLQMGSLIDQTFTWIVERMEQLIRSRRYTQGDIRLCLVGHSRGAVGVMKVANMLEEGTIRIALSRELRSPISVHFMGLYDAVDRTLGSSPETTLANVAHCYHAQRMRMFVDPAKGSRGSFGGVRVTRANDQGHLGVFDTSHGGIGGDPGFFTPLGQLGEDYYCNALTFILTQEELTREYGLVTPGGPYGAELGATHPRYAPLQGAERQARRGALARFLKASGDADTFIRAGAQAAGLRFAGTSQHLPFDPADHDYFDRLKAALG